MPPHNIYPEEAMTECSPSDEESTKPTRTPVPADTVQTMDKLDTTGEQGAKPFNRYLRWNLLFTFIISLFLSFPFWFPFIPIVGLATFEVILATMLIFQLIWLSATMNATKFVLKLRRKRRLSLRKVGNVESCMKICGIKHFVAICMYKEPLELMVNTVDSLVRQKDAKAKISVAVGLEERTPERESKEKLLRERYKNKFERFIVTVHPSKVPGELPGKCSNLNYTARQGITLLKSDTSYGLLHNDILVTTGDCDTIFPNDYMETLEMAYVTLSPAERTKTVWQSPLFYQMGMEKSPFFVRVTSLLRSFFMMGILIPWNINTMSVFSLTLKLYEEGEYTHPGYQMDDIIAMIRWSLKTKTFCRIHSLDVATMSGPTSGKNYIQELVEWARQIQRWTIGAGEVFHYFLIKSRSLPLSAAVPWGLKFIIYYGLALCVAPIFSIAAPPISILMMKINGQMIKGVLIPNEVVFSWILLGFLVLQYLWLAIVFWLNKLAENTFPDKIRDETNFFLSFLHWVLALPTIIGYCFVELWAFVLLTVKGKSVCNHKPSKKDNLIAITTKK